MIPDDEIPKIRFSADDVPELAEISQAEIQARREADRQRKEMTVRWLEEHSGFRPFGDVW